MKGKDNIRLKYITDCILTPYLGLVNMCITELKYIVLILIDWTHRNVLRVEMKTDVLENHKTKITLFLSVF